MGEFTFNESQLQNFRSLPGSQRWENAHQAVRITLRGEIGMYSILECSMFLLTYNGA